MGDEDDFKVFVKLNLKLLTQSTNIGAELVLDLYQSDVINEEEMQLLSNPNTINMRKTMMLYTTILNKWNQSKFYEFKKALLATGHTRAYEVFTNAGAEFFLTNDQVQILRKQREKESAGRYEGFSYEDEDTANQVVELTKGDLLFKEGVFKLNLNLERRKQVIPLVKNFVESLKKGTIWWNTKKLRMPSNHIPRRISKTDHFREDGTLLPYIEPINLMVKLTGSIEQFNPDSKDFVSGETEMIVNEKLVLLVDPPGMGKTSELTYLEEQLRKVVPTNRIIIRLNLNEVYRAFSSALDCKTASNALVNLAPFLPLEALQTRGVCVFVLLDGLDEVCPKYEKSMIKLLHVLNRSNEPNDLRVVVSTRTHLKEVVEEEFHVESYSLFPLTHSEQVNYMQAEIGIKSHLAFELQNKLSISLKELLRNPLMLSMLVDIIKSERNLSQFNVDIYELYLRFVEAKHKLQLVQKEGMGEDSNFTEMRVECVLSRNLPSYFHIAIQEITNLEANVFKSMFGNCKNIAQEVPSELKADLLNFGILVKDNWNNLQFKHRSFGEFFYAMFLVDPKTTQEVRDSLFGRIYKGYSVLENVEKFVREALKEETLRTQFKLSSKWLPLQDLLSERYRCLPNFVNKGQLFPVVVREVLMTFVRKDDSDSLEAFSLLVHRRTRRALNNLVGFICKNAQWSRRHLFNVETNSTISSTEIIYPPAARLIIAIAMIFEDQLLFTSEELRRALKSCESLFFTVATIHTDKMTKWDFVERHSGGIHLRELIEKADHSDWLRIINDPETVKKLWATFTRDELYSLVSDEQTRRSDVVGWEPLRVLICFGEGFLYPYPQFRSIHAGNRSWNSGIELAGSCFALDLVCLSLKKEMEGKMYNGPATATLRKKRPLWEVFWKLEEQIRRKRKCPRDSEDDENVIEWLVGGGLLWDQLHSFPINLLPYVVRYSGTTDHVTRAIQQNKEFMKSGEVSWKLLLKSLLISCHYDNHGCYSLIVDFIKENHPHVPPKLECMIEAFVGAKEEQLKASFTTRRPSLVADVSVGLSFLGLMSNSTVNVDKEVFRGHLGDAILSTRCCDIPTTLQKLKFISQKELRKILLSSEVFKFWQWRLLWCDTKMEDVSCTIRGFLSFYFSVFGVHLNWMEERGTLLTGLQTYLVPGLPVEIAAALDGNPEWTSLSLPFESIVRKFFRYCNIDTVNKFADRIHFKTEGEWMRLIQMVGEESFNPGPSANRDIFCGYAAPLIRALTKTFGADGARNRVKSLWKQIPNNLDFPSDAPQTKASILHSAIELGELEVVETFAYPGIVAWRNPVGKNAFDVAVDAFGKDHTISLLMQEHVNLQNRESNM